MTTELIIDKTELTELANKLFMYCDGRQWDQMLAEVFTPVIWFDASSVGAGDPRSMEAKDVCNMWNDGFAGLDAIHHQSGHYLINCAGMTKLIFMVTALLPTIKKRLPKAIQEPLLAAMISKRNVPVMAGGFHSLSST